VLTLKAFSASLRPEESPFKNGPFKNESFLSILRVHTQHRREKMREKAGRKHFDVEEKNNEEQKEED
jgi:hypothetical protein